MKNIFVVGGATGYANFIFDHQLVDNINDADIIIFTGGEDVDPSMYGCKKLSSTYSNIERDRIEKEVFDSIPKDKLVVGICRGSQFCTVMNGGLLVQDVKNHSLWKTHEIANSRMVYQITSTHHQMMYPYNLSDKSYKVLYKAYPSRSEGHYLGEGINPNIIAQKGEPEIVLYTVTNKPTCLCIQGHPEMMSKDHETVKMINELIDKYI